MLWFLREVFHILCRKLRFSWIFGYKNEAVAFFYFATASFADHIEDRLLRISHHRAMAIMLYTYSSLFSTTGGIKVSMAFTIFG